MKKICKVEDCYIYGLECPIIKKIRYVGKTIDLDARFMRHIKYELNSNSHKTRWIKKLLAKGLKPKLIILEKIDNSEWQKKEKYWINHFKSKNLLLTNETNGGDGREKGFKHKKESIRKIKIALKNRNPEIRKKAGIKISLALKGKKASDITKKNMSKSGKKVWDNMTKKERIKRINNLQHEWTKESKEKISATHRGMIRPNNKSGIAGVSWYKRDKKWRAWLSYDKKQIHLGYFTNFKDAVFARTQAELIYHANI